MALPVDVEDAAARLTDIYTTALDHLRAELAAVSDAPSLVAQRRRLRGLVSTLEHVLAETTQQAKMWVGEDLPRVYERGMGTFVTHVAAVTAAAPGDVLVDFTIPSRPAVERLASGLTDDLLSATSYVARDSKRAIRRAVQSGSLAKVVEGRSLREAKADVVRELESLGIGTVRYANGARVPLDVYASMAVTSTTARAYNGGMLDAGRANGVEFFEVFDGPDCGWTDHDDEDLADGTIRTREECEQFPEAHPHAVLEGSTFGAYGDLEELVRARYSGPALRLRTANGHTTTIGPNHPMLTLRGWVPARLLNEGDQLVEDTRMPCSSRLAAAATESDLEQMPVVEDAFEALRSTFPRMRVVTSGDDLHGDGVFCQGEIEAVRPFGRLLVEQPTSLRQHRREDVFLGSDAELLLVSADGTSEQFGVRRFSTSNRSVGLGSAGRSLRGGALGGLQTQSGGSGSTCPSVLEHFSHAASRDAEVSGYFVGTESALVEPDGLVAVDSMLGAHVRAESSVSVLGLDGRHGSTTLTRERPLAMGSVAGPGAEPPGCLGMTVETDTALLTLELEGHPFLPASIASVEEVHFEGWAFDATTSLGAYVSDGFVVRNCRRSFGPRPDLTTPEDAADAEPLGGFVDIGSGPPEPPTPLRPRQAKRQARADARRRRRHRTTD